MLLDWEGWLADEHQEERILRLARHVYGEGECELFVTGADASISRGGRHLCLVAAFDGDPLGALERFLKRQAPAH